MLGFSNINTFIFDVDGVFTDGTLQAFRNGEQIRTFYIKDGYAVERALKYGYKIIIISGGMDESVKTRMQFLGIKDVFIGIKDKVALFEKYKEENDIKTDQILYMGDDIPDYKMLKLAGLPTCPADAVEDIRQICKYISPFPGGRGAVRDVIEKVMRSQGKWEIEKW